MSAIDTNSDANGVCRRITVQEGDSCPILELKWDVATEDIESYNPGNYCGPDWPVAGQVICLSAGYLPPTPQIQGNGTCSTYTVPQNATCATIASSTAFTIQVSQIQEYNNQTCSSSFPVAGALICLSKGLPPPKPSNSILQSNPSMITVPLSIAAIVLLILAGLMFWHCKRQSRAVEGTSNDKRAQRRWFRKQPMLASPRDSRRDTLIMIV